MDCCCPCRARRLFITATKSAWGTTYISATGTAFARQCSGTGDGTAGFPLATRGGGIFLGFFRWVLGDREWSVERRSGPGDSPSRCVEAASCRRDFVSVIPPADVVVL